MGEGKKANLSLYTSRKRKESSNISPLILNFATLWSLVVIFTPGKHPARQQIGG